MTRLPLSRRRFLSALGTGAATYGTVMSDNSAVYAEIGLQNSRYFVEKDGIYDSNFASLLGEFGFIGLFMFFIVFNRVITMPMSKSELYLSESEFRFVLLKPSKKLGL